MMNVLVTGYNGFIGKNLVVTLEQLTDIEILKFGKNHSIDYLEELVEKADFIFHLAGINRPEHESEYANGNKELTEKLIELLNKHSKHIPIVLSSSTQADQMNAYGLSKIGAEEAVIQYGKKVGSEVYIYRLPNVFGKWCRPNYNSVVATWCFNIANDLPITIHDENKTIKLVYIDYVIQEFLTTLKNNDKKSGIQPYQEIHETFEIRLGDLANKLRSFKESRYSLIQPSLEDKFDKYLYSTYLSYLNNNDFGYNLTMRHDNRGWLAEFIKSDQFGQIFISRTKSGITRGNHWHHTKVEKFLVIEGNAVIRFRHVMENKETLEYVVSGENLQVIDIPPGYTHSIENVGKTDVITLFWANEIFDAGKPDTFFLEV